MLQMFKSAQTAELVDVCWINSNLVKSTEDRIKYYLREISRPDICCTVIVKCYIVFTAYCSILTYNLSPSDRLESLAIIYFILVKLKLV